MNTEGLPKLPGLDFENRFKSNYRVSQTFNLVNGYAIPKSPIPGIGDDPPPEQSIAFPRSESIAMYDPILTYGRLKRPQTKPFIPKYVLYDKKALTFKAFFKQTVPESPIEHYRVRFVNIIYFLEDDSITVMEPEVVNSGIPQGRLIRRGKMPKNVNGEYYSWKDFNIGTDIEMNGIVFHITDCDGYTREFLISQGVELNDAEYPPVDPVTVNRKINVVNTMNKTPSDDDKLRRFLEFQGKILKFDCMLDESDQECAGTMTYQMFYFLQDDTVSIRELPENQEGRDRFPMLLRKTKLPKNWKARPVNFPAIYLELGDNEVMEYYQPKDFRIGSTIYVYGRRFLLLDCDKFTRQYFKDVLKQPQGNRLTIKYPPERQSRRAIPEYLGLGTPEDSLASCHGLIPKAPKKDIVKYLLNTNKFLRFGCVLDSAHPEDTIRRFVISYSLADDTILINEPPIKNSGIIGGRFLASQRVKVPGCNPNMPVYYGPKDFGIGEILKINDHRFKIVSADLFVYQYMLQNRELFSKEQIEGVRNHLLIEGHLRNEVKAAMDYVNKQGDAEAMQHHDIPPEGQASDQDNVASCLKALTTPEASAGGNVGGAEASVQDSFPMATETDPCEDKDVCPKCPFNIKPTPEEYLPKPCFKPGFADCDQNALLKRQTNGAGDGAPGPKVQFSAEGCQ